jgi:hypothetical protein
MQNPSQSPAEAYLLRLLRDRAEERLQVWGVTGFLAGAFAVEHLPYGWPLAGGIGILVGGGLLYLRRLVNGWPDRIAAAELRREMARHGPPPWAAPPPQDEDATPRLQLCTARFGLLVSPAWRRPRFVRVVTYGAHDDGIDVDDRLAEAYRTLRLPIILMDGLNPEQRDFCLRVAAWRLISAHLGDQDARELLADATGRGSAEHLVATCRQRQFQGPVDNL